MVARAPTCAFATPGAARNSGRGAGTGRSVFSSCEGAGGRTDAARARVRRAGGRPQPSPPPTPSAPSSSSPSSSAAPAVWAAAAAAPGPAPPAASSRRIWGARGECECVSVCAGRRAQGAGRTSGQPVHAGASRCVPWLALWQTPLCNKARVLSERAACTTPAVLACCCQWQQQCYGWFSVRHLAEETWKATLEQINELLEKGLIGSPVLRLLARLKDPSFFSCTCAVC